MNNAPFRVCLPSFGDGDIRLLRRYMSMAASPVHILLVLIVLATFLIQSNRFSIAPDAAAGGRFFCSFPW